MSLAEANAPILGYTSNDRSRAFVLSQRLLMAWGILSLLATPMGWLIGGAGTYVATMPIREPRADTSWNIHSVEDWIGFGLWMVNASSMLFLPPLWFVRCIRCRDLVARGDLRGMIQAQRLCRPPLAAAGLFGVGIVYGMLKALIHGRWEEFWWPWMVLMLGLFTLAVEITRRVLKAAMRQVGCGVG